MATIRINQGRLFSGLLIILIGVLFLLGALGKLDVGHILSIYWPLILIFIGLWILIAYNFQNMLTGIILIVIGGFFMLNNLDVLEHKVWYYFWPLLIIAVGFWIIFRPGLRAGRKKIPEIKEDDLNAFIIFAGMNRRIESQKFQGGKATAIFGGMELDFTQAGLAGNEATVELTTVFGGIELRLPKEWEVIVDSIPIFGAVEDKRKPVPKTETSSKLYVKATAIFGGIEIKS